MYYNVLHENFLYFIVNNGYNGYNIVVYCYNIFCILQYCDWHYEWPGSHMNLERVLRQRAKGPSL